MRTCWKVSIANPQMLSPILLSAGIFSTSVEKEVKEIHNSLCEKSWQDNGVLSRDQRGETELLPGEVTVVYLFHTKATVPSMKNVSVMLTYG